MTDEYTPTTEEVRLAHAESVTLHLMQEPVLSEANAMFDRWLAAHDAEVEARGLEKAAEAAFRVTANMHGGFSNWLNRRAQQVREGDAK